MKIYGSVKDSLDVPIPFAQVLISTVDNNRLIGFTQSNNYGKYNFVISTPDNYILSFRALSFEELKIPLVLSNSSNNNSFKINANLKSKHIHIDQVVFKGKSPISVRSDTVIFRVNAFTRGTEQVVEDIFKLLPGIEVSSDGKITWQGKEIEKIMVEDDDLFGKGYRLLSRNLQASVIDEVTVIERYSHNPLLKNIEESDRVALNLVLKENVKFTTFGNTSVGYSTNHKHLLRANLMSFSKKQKFYLFGNSNSIGLDPVGNINSFLNPQSSYDHNTSDYFSTHQFQINLRGFQPNLNNNRFRDHNSHMVSPSIIINPSGKLSAKIVTYGVSDLDNFSRWGYNNYIVSDTTFTYTENHFLKKKSVNGFTKLEITYRPTSNALIEYSGQTVFLSDNSNSELLTNGSQLFEEVNSYIVNSTQNITITNRISNKTAVIFKGMYHYVKIPEKFNVINVPLWDFFTKNDSINNLTQSIHTQSQSALGELKSISRIDDNIIFNTQVVGYVSNQIVQSELMQNFKNSTASKIGSDFTNKLNYKSIGANAGCDMSLKFKSVKLNSAINGNWLLLTNIHNWENDEFFYIVPKLGLLWDPASKSRVNLVYTYMANRSTIMDLASGFILKDYRTISTGYDDFLIFRGHASILNYSYGKNAGRFLFNYSFIYNKSKNDFTTDSHITPFYNVIKYLPTDRRESFSSTFSTDFFIKTLHSNLKFKGAHSLLRFDKVINNKLNLYSIQSVSLSCEFRSAFKGFFNYHFGTNWSLQRFQSSHINSNADNYQFLDLYFIFSRSLWAKLNLERYQFGNIQSHSNPWIFVDVSVSYDYLPNKLSFSLKGNNLLNNKEFGRYSINEISEIATIYRIVPRNIMFSTELRF
ncbi:MAG: TonB-dependent receptor [bacterium]